MGRKKKELTETENSEVMNDTEESLDDKNKAKKRTKNTKKTGPLKKEDHKNLKIDVIDEEEVEEEDGEFIEDDEIDILKVSESVNKELVDMIRDIKLKCLDERVPLFVAYAKRNDKNETEYYTDCVYAAVEMPEHGKRIADLLVTMLGADVKYPDYVQAAINTLQTWLDNERTFEGAVLSDNKFRNYVDVATGQMEPSVIKEYNEDEVEVTTASKLRDKKKKD